MLLAPGWLRLARARCDLPPARPREPLRAAGHDREAVTIGSIEPDHARRAADAGLPLRRHGDAWRIDALAGAELDAALDRIAHWLASERLVGGWRDERLRVHDTAGRPVALIERAAVRALGIATRAVHLVGQAEGGGIWVQQRAFDKAVDPGLWDTLMGGLASADESVEATLARETLEEAGLRIADLRGLRRCGGFTVRRPVSDGHMIESIDLFEATLPTGLVPVNQDGEVAAFECVSAEQLAQRLVADAFTLDAAWLLGEWLAGGAAGSGAAPA